MKRLVLALAFASLFLCCQQSEQNKNAQSELKQVQDYQKSKRAVSDNDKFAVALETNKTSKNEKKFCAHSMTYIIFLKKENATRLLLAYANPIKDVYEN